MSDTDIVPARRRLETASATTDPDNANSGSFAYVLTAVVLVGLIVLGVAISGALGALAGRVLEVYASSGSTDLEQFLLAPDGGDTGQEQSQGTTGQGAGELSLSDALDLDLAPYSLTVDGEVSAMAYANVPGDVRTYVRNLLSYDSEAQQELARLLNEAAREDDPSSSMQAVIDAANNGKAAIESQVATPSFEDAELNESLAEARQATLDRWDAIISEVGVLNAGAGADETVSRSDLTSADNDVQEATQKAAEDVTEALGTAAGSHE